jgi:hypothetical protein
MAHVVTVPHPDEMDDDQFLKHMDKRHRQDFNNWWPLADFPSITEYQMELWRKFHDRAHRIALPDQYDHIHLQ